MTETPQSNTAPPAEEGYDHHEVNARFIAWLGAGVVVGLVVIVLAIQYYYDVNYQEEVYVRVLEPVSPDLKDLRAREAEELNSYRYIDRERGTVRLPIKRAMELLEAGYAAGKLPYPTKPYPVKPETPAAPAPAAAGGAAK